MHGDDNAEDAEDVQPSDEEYYEEAYLDENGIQMMQQSALLGTRSWQTPRRNKHDEDPPFWTAGRLPIAVCAILALAPLTSFIIFLLLVRYGVISLDLDIGVEKEERYPDTSFIDELHPPQHTL